MSIFDILNAIPEESGGGDGYIGKVRLEPGVTFLKTGYSCADFFVPISGAGDAGDAKTQLRRDAQEAGAGNVRIAKATRLTLYADSLKGAKRSSYDRVWVFATFFQSFSDPSVGLEKKLRDVGMIDPGDYWVHLKFAKNPDESRPKRYDEEGNERPDLFPYPAVVFANEEEATAAGNAQGGDVDEPVIEPWKVQLVHEAANSGASKESILAKYQGAVSSEEVDSILNGYALYDDIPF